MSDKSSLEDFVYGLTKCQSLEQGMERLSENILKQARDELGYSFPPVQSRKIAKLRKVKRVFEKDIEKAAYLTTIDGGFHICLRKSDPLYKKNFSCAHEIGHTFFFDLSYRVPKPIKIGNVQQRIIEKLCERFAGSLLMPQIHFLSSWWKFERDFDFAQIEKLSHDFEVSPKSIVVRAMHLGALRDPKRFILLFEEKVHRKTGLHKKLRVNLAVIPSDSEIFVPSNIGVERLRLTRLLTKYKNHDLTELSALETMRTLKREPISRHFRSSEILCHAKYKSYGEKYVLGLFKVV
jgi:Zn-dependent peptidase ImmA (M78 family)